MKKTLCVLMVILGLFAFSTTVFAASASTVRISQEEIDGTVSNGQNNWPNINGDGSWATFSSYATNLDSSITNTNSKMQAYIHNTATGENILISVNKDDDTIAGNRDSFYPSISDDGKWAAFGSDSTDLIEGERSRREEIFLYNVSSGDTSQISNSYTGGDANRYTWYSQISGDGTKVLFETSATDIINDGLGGGCFVYNRLDENILRVSDPDVMPSPYTGCKGGTEPSINYDGSYVTFMSGFSTVTDVMLAYINTTTFEVEDIMLVSRDGYGIGEGGNGQSINPSVSSNGNYVSFQSMANDIDGITTDTDNLYDIYVYDRINDTHYHASVSSSGVNGNANSKMASVSDDGIVAFESTATNLVNQDNNGKQDVFTHDVITGKTARVSVADQGGGESAEDAGWSRINNIDGKHIVFDSNATDLVSDPDTNGTYDIFIRNTK
ncbi:TolB family protein [Nitrospirota bacterium]